ncbi:MAG: Na/Pi symporter [Bacteroidia bacterium]|nr:Na/Pi symporter [Bacteroidia bacterium]
MTDVILLLIAGLVLFLFGVTKLSDELKENIGSKAKFLIEKYTSTVLSGLILGTIATIILDSSSAVIILAIVMVNSNVITFRQTMGIVMGANIGTTMSSQIIAMNIGKYSPILLFIGFLIVFLSNSIKLKKYGNIILFFGLLFFGLHTMENAIEPLKQKNTFMEMLKSTENPIRGTLIGAFVTLIIQSSSATVGMSIVLAKKGIITLKGGIAVMMGAELGTCSDTLLATINGTRQALKTGLFHTTFNLLSIIIGLMFFNPFHNLIENLSGNVSHERALANAHVIFNVLGVLIFIWFIPFFEKILNLVIPDKIMNIKS